MTKSITFTPTPELEKRIERIQRNSPIRISKSSLAQHALDFVTAKLAKGEASLINGKIILASGQP